MGQKQKGANAIVEGIVWKNMLVFFFPILLGTIFQQLYNTADAVIVGKFVGKEALAAVGGSAAQIMNLTIGFFVGLSSGATVIVSQNFGANDSHAVSRSVHTSIALAIIGGAIVMVVGLIFTPFLLEVMDTPKETVDGSALYLRVIFFATIPNMVFNIGSGILRAVGDSRRPLLFLIVCSLMNVALDLLFVLGFNMGVAGAALATGLSQLCSAVLVCVSLRQTSDSYRLSVKKIYPHGDLMKKIIRIGIPAGLQTTMYTVSNMIITAGINSFGTTTVAAWVAQSKVDSMYWMINGAFGVTIATFVGQNYGANRHDRVRKCVKVWSLMSLGISLLISTVILLVAKFLFGMFSEDGEVIKLAMLFNWYVVPFYALFLPIELLSGTLRGMGVTLVPTLMTAVGICIFRTVWMFAVVPFWNSVPGIMVSYPISWFLTSIVFVVYYRKRRKVLLMYC